MYPMRFENHDKKGSYKLVSVARQQIINPGDTIVIDQYISGYGTGSGLKVVYYPSADIFDNDKSEFSFSIKKLDDGKFGWGGTTGKPNEHGVTMCQGPFWKFDDSPPSYFIDANEDKKNNQLLSETNIRGKSPFSYKLKTRKNTRPGNYRLNFCLTYFNGEEWETSDQICDFKINSFFERHSTLISFLAMVALLVSIIHDGAYPLYEWLSNTSANAILNKACDTINTSILHCS